MISQVRTHNTNLDSLRIAFVTGNVSLIRTLMGYSMPQYVALAASINTIDSALKARYPQLKAKIDSSTYCTLCDTNQINRFFYNYSNYTSVHGETMVHASINAGGQSDYYGGEGPNLLRCAWAYLTACLLAGSELGPFYAFAVWVCICAACMGGITLTICH